MVSRILALSRSSVAVAGIHADAGPCQNPSVWPCQNPGVFYHLTADGPDDNSCDCPEAQRPKLLGVATAMSWSTAGTCTTRLRRSRSWVRFLRWPLDCTSHRFRIPDNPPAIEVMDGEHGWLSWLSVQSGMDFNAVDGKRTIVRWHSGDFSCHACKHGNQRAKECRHRKRAKEFLVGTLGREVEGEVDVDQIDELVDMARSIRRSCNTVVMKNQLAHSLLAPDELPQKRGDPVVRDATRRTVKSTSSFPSTHPKSLACPPTRSSTTTRLRTATPRSSRSRIDHSLAHCACGNKGGAARSTVERSCRVYTTEGFVERRISVQKCGCHKP